MTKKKSDGSRIGSSLMFFCCGFVLGRAGKVFSLKDSGFHNNPEDV